MPWSDWKKFSKEPYFYTYGGESGTYGTEFPASASGRITEIATLDVKDYDVLNACIFGMSRANTTPEFVIYDESGNVIATTGQMGHQTMNLLTNIDISNYDSITLKIIGRTSASGTVTISMGELIMY